MEVWVKEGINFSTEVTFRLMQHHLLAALVTFVDVYRILQNVLLELRKSCQSIILFNLSLRTVWFYFLAYLERPSVILLLVMALVVTSSLESFTWPYALLIKLLKHLLLLLYKHWVIHHVAYARVGFHRFKLQILPFRPRHIDFIFKTIHSTHSDAHACLIRILFIY